MKLKKEIAVKLWAHHDAVESWFKDHACKAAPAFYSSVDLRDSGYKIAPVDSNLFPAGFNNICPTDQRTAAPLFKAAVERALSRTGKDPRGNKILIIPENHTQNKFYLENIYTLTQILQSAQFEVKLGWYAPQEAPNTLIELESVSGKKITAQILQVSAAGIASAGGFVPDLVLLNNDFSSGYPQLLDSIVQPVVPSHRLGWHTRTKGRHFELYNQLVGELCTLIGLDSWHLQVDTRTLNQVDFLKGQGVEEVARTVDQLVADQRKVLAAKGIKKEPFVFVKNNSGTYGMGIMVVHSGDEIRSMNRKEKNKMSVGKNGLAIDSVVVQEGIETTTLMDDNTVAEPVIYLTGMDCVGGFLRANTERGSEDNLNSKGMVFRKLCMADLRDFHDLAEDSKESELPVLEMVYGTVAKLSALATGLELKERE